MSLGRTLYRAASTAARPFLGLLVRQRVRSGKEQADRVNERYARAPMINLPGPVVWLHGASIGETKLLLALARALQAQRPALYFLFTSQTRTSAELINRQISSDPSLAGRSVHQFAPVDTPTIARRFINQWHPVTAIFAEGEIWPNLLRQARKRDVPTCLVNARMTQNTIDGWQKWPAFAKETFAGFDVILAANNQSASSLSDLAGRRVENVGNLKSALPPPATDTEAAQELIQHFVGDRSCLVAISTHEGEEAFFLDAAAHISPRPACIILPRHPERGDDIAALLESRSLRFARRSTGDPLSTGLDVLLADTLGEVGLFASIADTVYLGGAHTPGVGGHNPIEILRLRKPVATGPDLFNFEDMAAELSGHTGFYIVHTVEDLANGFPFAPPAEALISHLEAQASQPMQATLDAILPLLPEEQTA